MTHRVALATAAALLLAAALLVACGESSSSSTSSTATAKAKSGSGGAAVFTAAGCGGCHTLAGAHSHAMVGPNLDQLKPNTATVAKQVENGGGGMPVFRGQLTPAQIHAVAQFVAQNASNSSARASGSACPPWTCATPAEASVWLPVSSTLAGRPSHKRDRLRPDARSCLDAIVSDGWSRAPARRPVSARRLADGITLACA